MRFGYRLLHGQDPEELLEDSALFKALHDECQRRGHSIVGLPSGLDVDPPADLYYGRASRYRRANERDQRVDEVKYWHDDAFLNNCGRDFGVFQFDDAEAEVKRLHKLGHHAFLKSVRPKELAIKVPRGKSIFNVIDSMVYSYIDFNEPLLMVQEFVPDMEFEWRFFVVGRKVVTHSPNAVHLTPIDFGVYEGAHFSYGECCGFKTPRSRRTTYLPYYVFDGIQRLARKIARTMQQEDGVVDVAWSNNISRALCVEINPLVVGGVGLFACDVRALAKAIIRRDTRG